MASKKFKLNAEAIKKSNAKFKKLTKEQQRIEIAKDVLKQLDARKYVASRGTYLYSSLLEKLEDKLFESSRGMGEWENFDLQKALIEKQPKCHVCGIGACFVSMVRKVDGVAGYVTDDGEMRFKMKGVFSAKSLKDIETAFEMDPTFEGSAAAQVFGERAKSQTEALRAIMKNIIQHGDFKPGIDLTDEERKEARAVAKADNIRHGI